MGKFEVILYETKSGKIPVKDFINTLNNKDTAKVLRHIKLLEENGNELREPHSKKLEDDIFELRIKTDSKAIRILYFFFYHNSIILTNGFIKKQQKTPRGEIQKAQKYKNDYINRL